jgi:hypothetical protein
MLYHYCICRKVRAPNAVVRLSGAPSLHWPHVHTSSINVGGESVVYKSWIAEPLGSIRRFLMSRLSLQVFHLWRHVFSTAPPFILWWSNLEILFGPLHRSSPFIGEVRCQAIQTELDPYRAERTQKAVYIVRCLCYMLGYSICTLYI